jgi:hypothetical protein
MEWIREFASFDDISFSYLKICSNLLQFKPWQFGTVKNWDRKERYLPVAKANSPVRLDADLMAEATRHGQLFNRSAAETIEYWASLGKRVEKVVNPDVLLEIQSGAMNIDVKPARVNSVESESVFYQIEKRRKAGVLNQFVKQDHPVYQASKSHPGLLEQILPDGSVKTGRFKNGKFHSVNAKDKDKKKEKLK